MFGFVLELLNSAFTTLDDVLEETPAHQIVLATTAVYFLYYQYHNPWISRAWRSRNNKTPKQRAIDVAVDLTKYIPAVQAYLEKELDKNLSPTRDKLAEERESMNLRDEMPAEGLTPKAILAELDVDVADCLYDFEAVDEEHPDREEVVSDDDGQDSGALYAVHPKELTELLKEVYAKTALTNPMHAKWPRINAMQAEIIRWCQRLFHGSDKGYGILTHGGTTSIIEAMAAYVIDGRAKGIEHPEIVVPETAHAAFLKAAELTGAKLITVPVDPNTGAVTAQTMSRYLSNNTAVMVGSAPSFMNGIEDPIMDLAVLAKQRNIPFHVDACLGGFLTAFLDTDESPMDFRAKGVTSISADLHKYGYCPKGTSVCLFSTDSPALSVYAALNWPGGLYATPGILDGSTSGARVAEVYATLSYFGKAKYQKIAGDIVMLREAMAEQVAEIEDIEIFSDPSWSVLGLYSSTFNSHLIADELDKKGWKLNLLQNPDGFHLCLTHVHTLVDGLAEQFSDDLRQAIETVKAYPIDHKPTGNVKVYGAVGMMPTAVQKEVCKQYQQARLAYSGTMFSDPGEAATPDHEQQLNEHFAL